MSRNYSIRLRFLRNGTIDDRRIGKDCSNKNLQPLLIRHLAKTWAFDARR